MQAAKSRTVYYSLDRALNGEDEDREDQASPHRILNLRGLFVVSNSSLGQLLSLLFGDFSLLAR